MASGTGATGSSTSLWTSPSGLSECLRQEELRSVDLPQGIQRSASWRVPHLCEQRGSGARKDSPHPNGMLQGFRRRFTRKTFGSQPKPCPCAQTAEAPADSGRDETRTQVKKGVGWRPCDPTRSLGDEPHAPATATSTSSTHLRLA